MNHHETILHRTDFLLENAVSAKLEAIREAAYWRTKYEMLQTRIERLDHEIEGLKEELRISHDYSARWLP